MPQFEQLTAEYAKYVHEHEPHTLQFQLHKGEADDGRWALVERYVEEKQS